jgi:hypothetical protein
MTKRRECGTKQRHPTKADARAQLWSLIRGGSPPRSLSIYHCRFCHAWHVGHRKRH